MMICISGRPTDYSHQYTLQPIPVIIGPITSITDVSVQLYSIYDVHMEEEGVRLRWTHVDGGRGQAPSGRPHRKLKLESTNIILSSSHAKKLASFITRISSLDRIKSGNFSAIEINSINY